jgi:hypothetical protein
LTDRVHVVRDYFSIDLFKREIHSVDVVLSINNLEHIPNIIEYLHDVRQLLNPDTGSFYLVIPECLRQLQAGDLGICVHEHMSYFTPQTITYVPNRCGFFIERMHIREDTIFILARPQKTREELPDPAAQSNELLTLYGTKVQSNLEYFSALIAREQNDGPIGIHGCCAALNNGFGLLELHDNPDIFLFDGDSNKKGKYLPTFNRSILSSDDEKYGEMKRVIIAALTFYDEIARFVTTRHHIESRNIYPMIPSGDRGY